MQSSSIQAVSFDAAGTLLELAEPVARTYARLAQAHGVTVTEAAVAARFPEAFSVPWSGPRMQGDGRPFWRHVVATCTGSDDAALFEALYAHYAQAEAWRLAPGAVDALTRLRGRGLRVAMLSNWDTRLVPLLASLGLLAALDFVGVSGALGVEKPDERAFSAVADALGVPLAAILHVGDSVRADVEGARAAGAVGMRWTGFGAVFGAVDGGHHAG
ncbi:MAG: hypothetical protein CL927_00690 [Deltaproteobacteria bacterium]|nr:hypothetical protein [Deltaproteobacteria bacterium]